MTHNEILDCSEFHLNTGCQQPKLCVYRVRRTGKTQLWKTRPGHFKIPVKHGLYQSGYITHENVDIWHTADNCSLVNSHKAKENK